MHKMADHRRSRYLDDDDDRTKLDEMKRSTIPGGIAVDPIPATAADEITILYDGLLSQAGADQVYLHCGYGNPHNWHQVKDLRMEKTGRGWVKTFKLQDDSRLNFCFKDSANNWDNNNGINWSLEIHNGKQI